MKEPSERVLEDASLIQTLLEMEKEDERQT